MQRNERIDLAAELPITSQRIASYVLLGGAVVGVLSGAVFTGLSALSNSRAKKLSDATESRSLSVSEANDYRDALRDRDGLRNAALGSASVGLVLGALGFVLYAFDEPRVQPPQQRREGGGGGRESDGPMEVGATPLLGPGLVGASVSGRF